MKQTYKKLNKEGNFVNLLLFFLMKFVKKYITYEDAKISGFTENNIDEAATTKYRLS